MSHSRAGARQWFGLVLLALPALVIAMDFTALHLAVPALSADLQPSSAQLLWIVDIYGFMIAGLLIAMGTLGDRIGRRRLLLIGACAFTLASLAAAFSTSAPMLIGARALLGITGATLLPSTLSLISNIFTNPSQRRFAIAVWSTAFMLGSAIGPLAGGVLLQWFWWGSVFLPAVPVMVALVVLGPRLLPEFRSESAGRTDLLSVALAFTSILPGIYGIKEIATSGPSLLSVLGLLAGLGFGWLFVRRQRYLTNPLLDLGLFADRRFSVSLGTQATSLFTLAAVQFFLMQYLQLVLGLSPLHAGLLTVPGFVLGIAGNLVIPRLARVIRPSVLIAGALALCVVALIIIAGAGTDGLPAVITGFCLLNLALNPAMVVTYDLIITSAPPARAGTAAGTAETGNELGIAMGVAIAGSIGSAVYRQMVTPQTLPGGLPAGAAEAARDTLAGALAAAEDLPGPIAGDVVALASSAFSQGMQITALLLAGLLTAVAITEAVLLRRVPVGGQAATAHEDATH